MADRVDTKVKERPVHVYFISKADKFKDKNGHKDRDESFRPTHIVVMATSLKDGEKKAIKKIKKELGNDYKHSTIISEYWRKDGKIEDG